MEKLGALIRQQRKRLGLTQFQLAELLDCCPEAVYMWEHDIRRPRPTHLRALCSLFGVSIEYFI